MKRKLLIFVVLLAVIFSFTACDNNTPDNAYAGGVNLYPDKVIASVGYYTLSGNGHPYQRDVKIDLVNNLILTRDFNPFEYGEWPDDADEVVAVRD